MEALLWRPVPVRPEVLGEIANSTRPAIWHLMITSDEQAGFNRRLFLARKQFERSGLPGYIASISSATMVYKALCAAEQLQGQGISLRVINVSTLKPIDPPAVREMVAGVRGVVTVEEHSLIGGLGSAIAMILAGGGLPMKFIGVADRFGQSALDYDQLLNHYGLTETAVVDAVSEIVNGVPVGG